MALLTQAASTRMCQRLVAAIRLTGAIKVFRLAVTESLPERRLSESSAEAGATLRGHRHADACMLGHVLSFLAGHCEQSSSVCMCVL